MMLDTKAFWNANAALRQGGTSDIADDLYDMVTQDGMSVVLETLSNIAFGIASEDNPSALLYRTQEAWNEAGQVLSELSVHPAIEEVSPGA